MIKWDNGYKPPGTVLGLRQGSTNVSYLLSRREVLVKHSRVTIWAYFPFCPNSLIWHKGVCVGWGVSTQQDKDTGRSAISEPDGHHLVATEENCKVTCFPCGRRWPEKDYFYCRFQDSRARKEEPWFFPSRYTGDPTSLRCYENQMK